MGSTTRNRTWNSYIQHIHDRPALRKWSELNTSINRFNVINENIYGKLEVIHTEIQSLKGSERTEQDNHDRDKTLIKIEQQVGIIEEKKSK